LCYNTTVPVTQEPITLQLRGEYGTTYHFKLTTEIFVSDHRIGEWVNEIQGNFLINFEIKTLQ